MISKFFIRRPIFAMVISIIMVIVGVVSMLSLPTAQYPDLVPPEIQVQGTYTGTIIAANTLSTIATQSFSIAVAPNVSAILVFSPTNVLRGISSVLTTAVTNGAAPYSYSYQFRYGGAGSWTTAGFTTAVRTYIWMSNIEYRVQVTDSFGSSSQWTNAMLTVVQPASSPLAGTAVIGFSLGGVILDLPPLAGGSGSDSADHGNVTLNWNGSADKIYSIWCAGSLTADWQLYPGAEQIQGFDGSMSVTIQVNRNEPKMYFRIYF